MATARESKDPFDHKPVEHLSGTIEASEMQATELTSIPYGNHETVPNLFFILTMESFRT